MKRESNLMRNFENWTEVTRGIYRYVLGANFCYEIHILTHVLSTDIRTAKASLFVCGEWETKIDGSVFEREELLNSRPVIDCIDEAIADYNENVKE